MFTSFITLEGCDQTGWDIYQKSFPTIEYTVARQRFGHFESRDAAESKAKDIANASDLTFVKEYVSVIFIASHFGSYMAHIMTPYGLVETRGEKSAGLEEAIKEAKGIAEKDNLPYIPYKPIII